MGTMLVASLIPTYGTADDVVNSTVKTEVIIEAVAEQEIIMALSLEKAIEYALENSRDMIIQKMELEKSKISYDENIKAVKADIFDENYFDEKFDIVVSNPPYIESEVIRKLPIEVSKYEPKLALDGGTDGLDFYRQIVKVFEKIHEENSFICVEIGYNQKEAVEEIFKNSQLFEIIETDKDLGGNDRVVTGMT